MPIDSALFARLTPNARARVRFTPLTDPIWIHEGDDEEEAIHDAASDPLWSSILLHMSEQMHT